MNPLQGSGTRDNTLIRILVSRSEVDLKKIIEEYKAMFGRRLQEDIQARKRELCLFCSQGTCAESICILQKDTKGDYQQILLGLCGPH